mmetsp:Transcript_33034/g.106852  ORF Transcript_33034/g.106852 Transcript_33034/m.106852 type:complete len:214 (-) Transcript_33034:166-807(-)
MEMARLRRERRSALTAGAIGSAGQLCDQEADDTPAGDTDVSSTDVSSDPPSAAPAGDLPMLRVVLLDGVYNDARALLRTLRRRLPAAHVPPHVALHPDTLSIYHRASGKSYAAASAESVRRGQTGDEAALRVCTVEAAALMLQELGEPEATTTALVAAVVRNNQALGAYGAEERRLQRLARKEATPHQPRGSWARTNAAAAQGLPPPARPDAI